MCLLPQKLGFSCEEGSAGSSPPYYKLDVDVMCRAAKSSVFSFESAPNLAATVGNDEVCDGKMMSRMMNLRMRIALCSGVGSLNMSTPSEGKARRLGAVVDEPAPRVEQNSGRPSSPLLLLQAVFHMDMVMTPMAVVIEGYPSPSQQEVKNQG